MHQVKLSIKTLRNKKSFLKAMSQAFEFPPYFGQNLDALNDCMLFS